MQEGRDFYTLKEAFDEFVAKGQRCHLHTQVVDETLTDEVLIDQCELFEIPLDK